MLRDYQIEISDKATILLREYGIAYLSMQVRTGKTLTALRVADNYGASSVLFLTKKKAKQSIFDDYNKLHGWGFAPFHLDVQNYEQAHNLTPVYDLIILDEAHCLGQFPVPAKRIKEIKKLCHEKPTIYLSGTPTPESYSQIFHQLFVSSYSPFSHPSFYKWANEYVIVKKKYYFNRAINDYSTAKKELINEKIKHLFISYTQEEAGFEMPVNEHTLTVRMNDTTYNLANKLKKTRVYISAKGNEILADTEVKLMNKLHQIYSGSVLDEKGEYIAFDDSKAIFIKKHFEGKKIAIFYKYRGEAELIKKHFIITTSPEDFNSSDNFTFISQVQSGREGINLSTADCLVMFNIDYSAVSYWQSRSRLQTKDRIKDADVYWIFSEGGIEGKIYASVMNKKDYTLSHFKKDFNIKKVDNNLSTVE